VGLVAFGPRAKHKPSRPRARKHKRKPKHRTGGRAAKKKKRGKRKPKAPAGPKALLVLGTTGPAASPHAIRTAGLGARALVVRNGMSLGFWIADARVAKIKRLVVGLAVLPAKGKKRTARTADATDDAVFRDILERAGGRDGVTLPEGTLIAAPFDRCAVLKAVIDTALASEAVELYGTKVFEKWLPAAEDLYKKLCGSGGGPGPGAPGPGSGAVTTQGSPLTAAATVTLIKQEVMDVWNKLVAFFTNQPREAGASLRAAQPGAVTASGQILTFRVKGIAVPSGKPGDPGPDTTIHLQDLRPQPDGSMIVVSTSEAFKLAAGGDANQISTFNPTNFCVQAGDFPTLSLPSGYDPTFYPNGVSFQVAGNVPGSAMSAFTKFNGVNNGAQFTGTDQSGQELLLQWDLATGNQATALCPGGTKR
jgi:hypothetical protein